MTELLENHGLEASSRNLDRLAQHYYSLLPGELGRRPGRTLPGVPNLLQDLQQRDCHLALLTGNMPSSAQLKLEHYGLWNHFSFGIFGDLASHRPALAEPAWQLIEQNVKQDVIQDDVIIVGDTPLDVKLAQAMGCRCLAVCTGGFQEQDLQGACMVVEDLSPTQTILDWCFSNGPTQSDENPLGTHNG